MPQVNREVVVQPLTAERWDALAALFSEGGDPKWCWCQYFRVRGLDWSNSNPDANRERLHRQASAGPPPGLVALLGDRAVGWVSLGPRTPRDLAEAPRSPDDGAARDSHRGSRSSSEDNSVGPPPCGRSFGSNWRIGLPGG